VAYARFLARSERLSMAAIANKMEVGKTTCGGLCRVIGRPLPLPKAGALFSS